MPSIPQITEASISGTAIVGETLTAEATVTGNPTPSLTYQWQRKNAPDGNWHNINGATTQTYFLGPQCQHRYFRVIITATNSEGSATFTTDEVGPVLRYPIVVKPVLTGEAKIGATLTTTAEIECGFPEPEITIVWQRSADGSSWYDTDNTTNTYTVTELDIGRFIRSAVTATNEIGEDSKTSDPTGRISSRNFSKNTVLPTANAYLLEVKAGESVGVEYDSEHNPNEEPQIKWLGFADALIKVKSRVTQSGGLYDSYKEIIAIVPHIVDLKKSDQLKIRYKGTEIFYEIAELDVLDLDPGLPDAYKCYMVEK